MVQCNECRWESDGTQGMKMKKTQTQKNNNKQTVSARPPGVCEFAVFVFSEDAHCPKVAVVAGGWGGREGLGEW